MTSLDFKAQDWQFTMAMVGVAVPAIVLIMILQSKAVLEFRNKTADFVKNPFGRRKKQEDDHLQRSSITGRRQPDWKCMGDELKGGASV